MKNKLTIPIIIILAALFVLLVAYADENPTAFDTNGEVRTFNVSSGYLELSKVIENIKTKPYYEGYNTQTVEWMESLGNKKVFFENNSIVIMNTFDAGKIPQDPGITDVYIYNYFTAKVVENHDLCDRYHTVYYVQNVEFINQEIVSNGLA